MSENEPNVSKKMSLPTDWRFWGIALVVAIALLLSNAAPVLQVLSTIYTLSATAFFVVATVYLLKRL